MSHPTLRARPFDLALAAEHFAQAGFRQRGPDGILVNAAGTRLSLTINNGYESLTPVLVILQQEARKAGLDLQIETLDASASWKKVQEKNHDLAFAAFNVGVEPFLATGNVTTLKTPTTRPSSPTASRPTPTAR